MEIDWSATEVTRKNRWVEIFVTPFNGKRNRDKCFKNRERLCSRFDGRRCQRIRYSQEIRLWRWFDNLPTWSFRLLYVINLKVHKQLTIRRLNKPKFDPSSQLRLSRPLPNSLNIATRSTYPCSRRLTRSYRASASMTCWGNSVKWESEDFHLGLNVFKNKTNFFHLI